MRPAVGVVLAMGAEDEEGPDRMILLASKHRGRNWFRKEAAAT